LVKVFFFEGFIIQVAVFHLFAKEVFDANLIVRAFEVFKDGDALLQGLGEGVDGTGEHALYEHHKEGVGRVFGGDGEAVTLEGVIGDLFVEVSVRGIKSDLNGESLAARRGEGAADIGAAVADHHALETLAEFVEDLWIGKVVFKSAFEAGPGAEKFCVEQGNEGVKFGEIVLERGGGEKKEIFGFEGTGEFVVEGGGIFEAVGFVDDDEVPWDGFYEFAVVFHLGDIEGSDDTVVDLPDVFHRVAFFEGGAAIGIVDEEMFVEAVAHFLAPLGRQAGGNEDQDAADEPAQEEFLHNHAGLNGLAEADFVSEEGPASHPFKDAFGGGELVREEVNADAQGGHEDGHTAESPEELGVIFEAEIGNGGDPAAAVKVYEVLNGFPIKENAGDFFAQRRGVGPGLKRSDGKHRCRSFFHTDLVLKMLKRAVSNCFAVFGGRRNSETRPLWARCHLRTTVVRGIPHRRTGRMVTPRTLPTGM